MILKYRIGTGFWHLSPIMLTCHRHCLEYAGRAANFSERKARPAERPWCSPPPFPLSLYIFPLSGSILVSPCLIPISAGTQHVSAPREERPLWFLWLNSVLSLFEVYPVAGPRVSLRRVAYLRAPILFLRKCTQSISRPLTFRPSF